MVLHGTFSRRRGLRFDGKVLRAEGQAEPPWDVVLQRLVSVSTCICAQSNREVHRASTSDGISGGQPNRVQPRRTAQKKTTSQFKSSCFGLVHGSGKSHKEHTLSNHAKSEPSRVGRDWPVMSATLRLPDYGRVARQPVTTGGRVTVLSARV